MDWPGIFQAAEGFPVAVASALSLAPRRTQQEAPAPAPPSQEARTAYLAYEAAAADFMLNLHLIAELGVPPRMAGALWTWPVVYRAHGKIVEAASRMVATFGQIVILGTYEVAERGCELAEALDAAAQALSVRRRRITTTPDFRDKYQAAGKTFRAYLLAVRADMSLPPPPPTPEVSPGEGDEAGSSTGEVHASEPSSP